MKVFGEHKRAAAALVAAAALLGLAACAPAGTGTSSPASSSTAAAPATAESLATAPPSPSAHPGASSTVNAIVSGFPEQLLPLMPGATVKSSSFDKTGVPAKAALVGSIQSPAATVLAYYTGTLEAQGFKAVPGETVDAITSKDFLRGDSELVTITVTETAGVSAFDIGANVAAESVK